MSPDPQFLAGETLPASKLQRLADEDTYTPAVTAATSNPDLGTNPTQVGTIHLNGKLVTIVIDIVFGTTPTAGSGAYRIGLPATYPLAVGQPDHHCGMFRLIDSGTAESRASATIIAGADYVTLKTTNNHADVTNAAPWIWAAGDSLKGMVQYLTDFA